MSDTADQQAAESDARWERFKAAAVAGTARRETATVPGWYCRHERDEECGGCETDRWWAA